VITTSASVQTLPVDTAQNLKLKHAVTEFESVLLSSWLEQLRAAYSLDGDREGLAGGESMMSMATQAVATAMAARGGIGIGRLMYERLQQR